MTTIVELSYDNSNEQTSNAEWTNTFNPVEIDLLVFLFGIFLIAF